MRNISEALEGKDYSLRPQYTTILHPVRERLSLSVGSYVTIDSISKLSNRPDYPWCKETKPKIASYVGLSERTVFRGIVDGIKGGLLEKNPKGHLRASEKWLTEVELYKVQINRR